MEGERVDFSDGSANGEKGASSANTRPLEVLLGRDEKGSPVGAFLALASARVAR